MSYFELKRELEEKQTELFDKHGVFFAFNMEQFKEGAKGEKKITKLGVGGYLPTKNAKEFLREYDLLLDWYKGEVKKINHEQVIMCELDNHECFYTGNISSAMDVLEQFDFTKDQVQKIYLKRCNNNQLED